MTLRPATALLAVCLLAPPALAQPKPKAGGDLHGDPLPPGAVARLGADRFRHPAVVGGVAFSPDGKVIAGADRSGNVILWDAASGRPLRRLGDGQKLYPGVLFTPDGKHVFAAAEKGGVVMCDAATGKEVRRFASGGEQSARLALSADGTTLAAAVWNDGYGVRVWDVATGKQHHHLLKGHTSFLHEIALTADGKTLASAGHDGRVVLWDVAAGKALHRIKVEDREVFWVGFLPDGKTLFSTGMDRVLRIWDVATGKEKARRDCVFTHLTLSPDGKLLAPTYSTYLVVSEALSGKTVAQLDGKQRWLKCGAFSPDGKLFAAGGEDGAIRVWDVAKGVETRPAPGHSAYVVSANFLADGTVFTGSWDGAVRWWDAWTGREVRHYEGDSAVIHTAVSPDGRLLVSTHSDGSRYVMRARDIDTGKVVREWKCDKTGFGRIAFAPDGKLLATYGGREAIFWDLETGAEVLRLGGDEKTTTAVAFAPDGKTFAVIDGKGPAVAIWDRAAMNEIRRLGPEAGKAFTLAFAPDGSTVAVGGWHGDASMTLWDVGTGERRLELVGEAGPTWALAFAPDGKTLAWAAAARDQVYLVDLAAGRVSGALRGHKGSVFALSFARDGKLLASGSADGTALVWDVAKAALPGRPAGASFTDKELEALWADLGVNNVAPGPEANRAALYLVSDADRAVAFFEKHLRPAAVDGEAVAKLLKPLEQTGGAARTQAVMALIALGEAAEPELRKMLKGKLSAQARAGIEQVLKHREIWGPTEDERRSWRAVAVLEKIATPAAWRHLKALAAGSPEARLTREARAALERRPR